MSLTADRGSSTAVARPTTDHMGLLLLFGTYVALIAGRFRLGALPDLDLRFVFLYGLGLGLVVWRVGRAGLARRVPSIGLGPGLGWFTAWCGLLALSSFWSAPGARVGPALLDMFFLFVFAVIAMAIAARLSSDQISSVWLWVVVTATVFLGLALYIGPGAQGPIRGSRGRTERVRPYHDHRGPRSPVPVPNHSAYVVTATDSLLRRRRSSLWQPGRSAVGTDRVSAGWRACVPAYRPSLGGLLVDGRSVSRLGGIDSVEPQHRRIRVLPEPIPRPNPWRALRVGSRADIRTSLEHLHRASRDRFGVGWVLRLPAGRIAV